MFGHKVTIERKLEKLKQSAGDPVQLLNGLKSLVSELQSKIPDSDSIPIEKSAEIYQKNLIKSPVFVCCCIPQEAFYLASNSLKPLNKDLIHRIRVGKRDDCGGIDEEEKLADALLGFSSLLPASGIQVVLKFENMFDYDLFCRDRFAGIMQVKKYYTPEPGKDFSTAPIVNKQDRLKLCVAHNVACISTFHRRNELIEKIGKHKDFVDSQIRRLTGLKAQNSTKGQNFATIAVNLDELKKEVGKLSDEQATEQVLRNHEDQLNQLHNWLCEVCRVHRDEGPLGLVKLTKFRNAQSKTEYIQHEIAKYKA